jgi:hypothetical protein
MNITELNAIRQDAQEAAAALRQIQQAGITDLDAMRQQVQQTAIEAKTSYEVSFANEYESFVIETTKASDLPKIEKFTIKERGVFGKKGEECHGRYYVIVRVNGEWFDLPAFCERFKCKCGGQNGFTDREKAKNFGEKALAKWGVESNKGSNGAADVLKSLGYEYDKKSKKWVKKTVEIRK